VPFVGKVYFTIDLTWKSWLIYANTLT